MSAARYRNLNGQWVLAGHGLTVGQTVEVSLRSGATKTRIVGATIDTLDDGTVLAADGGPARDASPRPAQPAPAAPAADARETTGETTGFIRKTTTRMRRAQAMTWAPKVGDILTLSDDRVIRVERVTVEFVRDDALSTCGCFGDAPHWHALGRGAVLVPTDDDRLAQAERAARAAQAEAERAARADAAAARANAEQPTMAELGITS